MRYRPKVAAPTPRCDSILLGLQPAQLEEALQLCASAPPRPSESNGTHSTPLASGLIPS